MSVAARCYLTKLTSLIPLLELQTKEAFTDRNPSTKPGGSVLYKKIGALCSIFSYQINLKKK